MTGRAKEITEKLKNAAISFNKRQPITDEETLKSEVDLISKEFGWSEGEILNLPDMRRRSYISLILAKYKS